MVHVGLFGKNPSNGIYPIFQIQYTKLQFVYFVCNYKVQVKCDYSKHLDSLSWHDVYDMFMTKD